MGSETEQAAAHAERVAGRLAARGDRSGEGLLRLFAASLRAGAHLRPAADREEQAARAAAILGDVLKRGE